ncbi:serine dehydratase alpha chain-domain-containing protein [Radiomyces spectabilis]|uniref:serine dehydratase alpha chain-domain-containing protein n=1 Tax=Radiomyces spectabilis TaxID=64574 RepID=UPI00221EF090|nr:serine dehydratase alpha chain-domain-containing protein [Radiomyces spectabilis]KAI8377550.1 serine dehydratase alpha chain-domain-containing protein [Radiomyces spectabilis]
MVSVQRHRTQYSVAACRFYTSSSPSSSSSAAEEASGNTASDGSATEADHHAVVSTFDLFSIGVGPSSSHTVGPMRAAKFFVDDLKKHNILDQVDTIRVDMFGSLALTGTGHGTPDAILMGLEGEVPDLIEPSSTKSRIKDIYQNKSLRLNGSHRIEFDPEKHLIFNYFKSLPQHPNGMRFCVFDKAGNLKATNEYFSIGGGFVVNDATQLQHGDNVYYKHEDGEGSKAMAGRRKQDAAVVTLPFRNADELLDVCKREKMTIAQVVFENELRWSTPEEIRAKLLRLWNTMDESIRNGVMAAPNDHLPGALKVPRRAPALYSKLLKGLYGPLPDRTAYNDSRIPIPSTSLTESLKDSKSLHEQDHAYSSAKFPLSLSVLPKRQRKRFFLPALDYLSVYAIAVNEENACGGRVVTAPTNGAAGTIPSVLKYYLEFISEHPEHDVMEFLLTTAAIGMLFKRGASISAAEVGCQGEVGVACSMAAAGFTAVMGGTVDQVENAAEIGMEHNLGLTCDPISGLVQVPCIERNALAAVKAIAAAQLALNGEGDHRVSLDQVIETMRQTGADMMSKYKETSQGGLAVNVPLC